MTLIVDPYAALVLGTAATGVGFFLLLLAVVLENRAECQRTDLWRRRAEAILWSGTVEYGESRYRGQERDEFWAVVDRKVDRLLDQGVEL